MKKLLVILTALTLIFALAISSSAATLSSNWKNLAAYTSGYTAGTVTVNSDDSIILDTATDGTGNYNQAGIGFKDKVAVNNLTIVLDVGIADASTAGAAAGLGFGVLLSGDTIGDFVAYTATNNVLGGNTMAPGADLAKTAAYFAWFNTASTYGFYGALGGLTAGKVTLDQPVNVNANSEVTVKFVVNGDNIDFYVNGSKASAFSVAKADILDSNGKANLAIFNMGLGWAGQVVTVKSVNGVAANDWTGTAASGTTTPDTADIDVVVIAAAAIVALAAAAFVLKARKA